MKSVKITYNYGKIDTAAFV